MEYSSFTAWVKAQDGRNDSVGDLARDIRQDRCWPGRSQNKERFLYHLEVVHEASGPALVAFQKAWREWENRPVSGLPAAGRATKRPGC